MGMVTIPPADSDRQDITRPFLIWKNHLYFVASTQGFGSELWRSDGTSAGTAMLADIYPGAFSGFNTVTSLLMPLADRLLFEAYGGPNKRGFWSTDGTAGRFGRIVTITRYAESAGRLASSASMRVSLLTGFGDTPSSATNSNSPNIISSVDCSPNVTARSGSGLLGLSAELS